MTEFEKGIDPGSTANPLQVASEIAELIATGQSRPEIDELHRELAVDALVHAGYAIEDAPSELDKLVEYHRSTDGEA